jgi:lincosamide nucleotidyltransferase A/C/D/E
MSAEDALGHVECLEGIGIDVWLDGGWGVDAALGTQTRPHDDLDLIVELQAVGRLQAALEARGYTVARGGPPKSFELTDREGRQVDVHPVAFNDSGDGVYRLEDGGDWVYPAAGFEGTGSILGRRVRCLTPEVQLFCHSGYEPHRTSFDDVHTLCERFSLPVPDEYRGSPEAYPRRAG